MDEIGEVEEEKLDNYRSSTQGVDYTSDVSDNDTTATTPSATTTATTPPAIDKTKITIKVLNGNGISGSAGGVKTLLETNGFTVDSVTNAYKFTYTNTIIYYKTGKSAEADLVKDTLSSRQCELNNNDSVAGNYDIVVVVGKT